MSAEGKAITKKFTEHLSNKLKERAAVWKQERLYREERQHLDAAASGSGGAGGKGKTGKGKEGKGRAKAKSLWWSRQ